MANQTPVSGSWPTSQRLPCAYTYYLLRSGQLRSIKIGKLRRITNQHLAEFIASLETASQNETR
jgi:hypothetical protein